MTSKVSKNYFFGKKYLVLAIKFKILRIFKKIGTYVKEDMSIILVPRDIFNHHGNFQTNMSIFGPQG